MSQPKEFIFKSPYPELDIPNVSVPHFILEKIANHPDQSKAAFVDGSGDKRVITFAQYGGLVRKVCFLYIFNIHFNYTYLF